MFNEILITGGTGSFGKAFISSLLKMNIFQRICVYSRNEHQQADMRQELEDDERLRWFIGDVRDKQRLTRAMKDIGVVVHAAALKRIETVQYNVLEAVATNVQGTANVVNACLDAGVTRAVLLSSDKACEPQTLYGYTKALAEGIFLNAISYAGPNATTFNVTRYGNVAGSQGSVIPLWRSILARGETQVPMTNPDCTRYWMWLLEAVDLVLEAIYSQDSNRLFIPNLPAYRLGDLAQAMGVEPVITGLKHGEKLHESMRPGQTSQDAPRISVQELKAKLKNLP